MPVETVAAENPGCFGAALCAAGAASLTVKETLKTGPICLPQASYDEKYECFVNKIEETNAG
jgi:hypothetical protein